MANIGFKLATGRFETTNEDETIEVRDGSDAEIKRVGQIIKRTDKPGLWQVTKINTPYYSMRPAPNRKARRRMKNEQA